MNEIYLVEKYIEDDFSSPEVIEAWTDITKAEERIEDLKRQATYETYSIKTIGMNITHEEYMNYLYRV